MKQYLRKIKKVGVRALNVLPVSSIVAGTPRKCITLNEYLSGNAGAKKIPVLREKDILLPAPVMNVSSTPAVYEKVRRRKALEQFIAILDEGRVWGRNGGVITKED